MKKLSKLLVLGTAAFAACAGVYYFIKKNEDKDTAGDFDAFGDLTEESATDADRTYVPLNFNGESASDTAESKTSAKVEEPKPSPASAKVDEAPKSSPASAKADEK